MPLSAMLLARGDERLIVTTALFDGSNRPVATGLPTPFNLPHGNVMITRAALADAGTMKVSIQSPDRGWEIAGQVIAVFKDARGAPLPGRPGNINAAGDLMSKAEFSIPAGPGVFALNDVEVPMPANIPRSGSAEIRLFDPRAGAWLTAPVRVPLP
jgi:hypothetical protein